MKKIIYLVFFVVIGFYGWKYYKENYSKNIMTTFKVNQQEVVLENKKVLSKKVEMLIPNHFKKVSKSSAKNKKLLNTKPDEVYALSNGTVQVSLDMTDQTISDYKIKEYKDNLKITLEQSEDVSKILSSGIKIVDLKNVGYFELITSENKLYNFIYFVEIKGKLLIVQFTCPESLMDEWRPVAKSMMRSIKMIRAGNTN